MGTVLATPFFLSLVFITVGSTGMTLTMNPVQSLKIQARGVVNLSSVLQWSMTVTQALEQNVILLVSCNKSQDTGSVRGKTTKGNRARSG